jgi:hypothetical protein
MRRFLMPGLALGFATMACAAATRPGAPAQASAKAAQSGPGAIVIREQSNVCVWVRVDPRIGPVPLSAYAEWSFSNLLATELGLRYQRQGGTLILPGRTPEGNLDPRFVANLDGGSRFCRRDSDDIYLTVRYLPRPDGSPFLTEYRIEQGPAVRTGVLPRNLETEERARRITNSYPGTDVRYAIALDIRGRADLLITFMAQLR